MAVPYDFYYRGTSRCAGAKCRASKVEVLEIKVADGSRRVRAAFNYHNASQKKTRYTVGKTVRPDSFDKGLGIGCAHGIHFFPTYRNARFY